MTETWLVQAARICEGRQRNADEKLGLRLGYFSAAQSAGGTPYGQHGLPECGIALEVGQSGHLEVSQNARNA